MSIRPGVQQDHPNKPDMAGVLSATFACLCWFDSYVTPAVGHTKSRTPIVRKNTELVTANLNLAVKKSYRSDRRKNRGQSTSRKYTVHRGPSPRTSHPRHTTEQLISSPQHWGDLTFPCPSEHFAISTIAPPSSVNVS